MYRHPFLIDSSTASSEPHKKIIRDILPKIYNQNAAFIFSCYEKAEVNIVCELLNKTKKIMPQCIFELTENEMKQLPKLTEQKNARFFLAKQKVPEFDKMTHREKYVLTGRALYKVHNQLENKIEDKQLENFNQIAIKTVGTDNSIETKVTTEINLLHNI
ncbi:MAG: hypothetical protein HYX60_01145 [Legionella longbeachae]|nr:hypothetical protein [Legionella longbeachae]